jgi:hypothetical protein
MGAIGNLRCHNTYLVSKRKWQIVFLRMPPRVSFSKRLEVVRNVGR